MILSWRSLYLQPIRVSTGLLELPISPTQPARSWLVTTIAQCISMKPPTKRWLSPQIILTLGFSMWLWVLVSQTPPNDWSTQLSFTQTSLTTWQTQMEMWHLNITKYCWVQLTHVWESPKHLGWLWPRCSMLCRATSGLAKTVGVLTVLLPSGARVSTVMNTQATIILTMVSKFTSTQMRLTIPRSLSTLWCVTVMIQTSPSATFWSTRPDTITHKKIRSF